MNEKKAKMVCIYFSFSLHINVPLSGVFVRVLVLEIYSACSVFFAHVPWSVLEVLRVGRVR